jgi:hypothetical protein
LEKSGTLKPTNTGVNEGAVNLESVLRFGAVILQIALLAVLFRMVRLESTVFRQILILAAVGFPVHHLLPLRFRLPFFVALSMVGIFITIGVVSGIWLVGVGLVLIGCCHVPAPLKVRLGLVLLVASVLAVLRAGWVEAPWSNSIWPILGAMFMFRLIVYLYDLVHDSAPFGFWRALAYFFMIPNICFPLFPVVDYQTFCKTHYNEDAYRIYQRGVNWMMRGAVQLLLYRFIYKFLIVGPAEIEGAGGFFQHMVATYLLYLQVSGMFHTIIGLLHLFGFNLPETNHHWALASSFTDFWRRINIYWKDFIMKVFFYPLYFRLRKLGNTRGMVLATMIAFIATWALHAYQWFWIRGSALVTLPDVIFWIILGILVTLSVWYESLAKKQVVPKTTMDSTKLATLLALKTLGTFLSITLLWSLWTSASMAEWQAVLLQWGNWSLDDAVKIVVVLGVLAVAAVVVGRDQWMVGGAARARASKLKPFPFWRSAVANVAVGVFICLLAIAEIQSRMPPTLAAVLATMETSSLNAKDAAEMQRGYYEDLIQVDRFNPELQAMYDKKPKKYFDEWRAKMNHQRDDYLGLDLTPSVTVTYEGVEYNTNEWGMRDKAYTKEKPAGIYRVGIIGSSHTMGWGINDHETGEHLAEARLNAEGLAYELLNFSVNGYDPIQKCMALEEKMIGFDLDAAIMFCHRIEKQWMIDHLVYRVLHSIEIKDAFLQDIVAKAKVDENTDNTLASIRLSAYGKDMVQWSLKRFVESCHGAGIKAVFAFMPEKGHISFSDKDVEELFSFAREAQFDLVEDYSNAYDDHPEKALRLSDYDDHPNALAHTLLGGKIFETIQNNEAILSSN